jgi:predicted component of type VI protein secretion system
MRVPTTTISRRASVRSSGCSADRLQSRIRADRAKLGLAGRYAPSVRSADGLEAILRDYFRLPISIRQFVGSWLPIPAESRTRLGVRGPSATLGRLRVAGRGVVAMPEPLRSHGRSARIRAVPRFHAGSRALREMSTLIRYYTTDEWSWQVRLLVAEQGGAWSLARPGRQAGLDELARAQARPRDRCRSCRAPEGLTVTSNNMTDSSSGERSWVTSAALRCSAS